MLRKLTQYVPDYKFICLTSDTYRSKVHIMHWQDTENPMVLPHAEPDDPTPEQDDGGEQRQRDTDTAKEISQRLLDALNQGLLSDVVEWPDSGPHKGKLW